MAPEIEAEPDMKAGQAGKPPIRSLLKASSYYLVGAVAGRVAGFLFIPFYARFLSPAQYGLIELIELSTQTIALTFGLQAAGAALSRLYYDQVTPEGQQAVVSTSFIANGVLSAVVMLLAVAAAHPLSRLVFHTDEWAHLLQASFVALFLSNLMEVTLVYERIRNNAKFFLWYSLASLVANLAFNVLFIGVLDAGVWGFVCSKLVVTTFGSTFLLVRIWRSVGWHWQAAFLPGLVRLGVPLVLSSLSYFAIHFSDRFILSNNVSLADLGRYALAFKLAILVSVLVGDSFAKSWEATLYRYVTTEGWQAQFARVASYLVFALFVTGLAVTLFSPELLRIMVPKDYYPPPQLMPLLVCSYIAREIGDFFRSMLLINKRAVRVSQIAAGAGVLSVAANLTLIPFFGIYGAAFALLTTWSCYMLACWVIANREHRVPVRTGAIVRILLLSCAFYALATGTRVDGLLLQIVLDGVWVLAFAGVAVVVFFSTEERRGLFDFAGTVRAWVQDRVRLRRIGA